MFKKHDRKSIFFMFYLSYLYQILLRYSNISILWDTVRFFVPWSDTMSGYKNKFNILFHNKKFFNKIIILFIWHLSIWINFFFPIKCFFHSRNCIYFDHGQLTDHGPNKCNFCYEKLHFFGKKSFSHILRCNFNNIIKVLKIFLLWKSILNLFL